MNSTAAADHGSLSATRSSALRARGLRCHFRLARALLAADELQARPRARAARPAGARARDRSASARCMNCLTARSSSEWKLMTARRPPGSSTSSAAGQTALELPELIVDEHAQRLKGARGRDSCPARACARRGDEARELRGARQGRLAGARSRWPAPRGAQSALRRRWRSPRESRRGSPERATQRPARHVSGPCAYRADRRPGS